MLEVFYPDEYRDSAYSVDYEGLAARGIRGVLFDIDNTLVPHGTPATDEAVRLFERIRGAGLSACLISNNREMRVRPFAEKTGASFLCKANKPSVKGYREACRRLGCDPEHAVFIGDQIFTDIYGANRAGIYSILVKPIHPKEEIQIVLKRRLEKIVLYFYFKSKKRKNREVLR